MPYTITETNLPEVLLLRPKIFFDDRGFFFESFNQRDFIKATGINVDFVQDNHSKSSKGVLRGLHYQINYPQAKLVRVVKGSVFDVAVDLRSSSPNFGKWVGVELSAANRCQLWIPAGFAHGFLTTSAEAEVLYKTDEYWYSEHERSLLWCDPSIDIQWPVLDKYILTNKDSEGELLSGHIDSLI